MRRHNRHRLQAIWAGYGTATVGSRTFSFAAGLTWPYLAGKGSRDGAECCHNPVTLHAVTRGMLVPSNAITVASRRQDTTNGWHSDWSPSPASKLESIRIDRSALGGKTGRQLKILRYALILLRYARKTMRTKKRERENVGGLCPIGM